MIQIASIPAEGPAFEAFLDFPETIYDRNSPWRARPSVRTRQLLDQARNPYWRQAEYALFMAWEGVRPIGRISAVRRFPAGQRGVGETDGFFGFFECIPDLAAARGLLQAAANWLLERGCTRMLGPCQPTPDYDSYGLLIEGFDQLQVSGESFNPEYYPGLCEQFGLRKERDFISVMNRVDGNPIYDRAMAQMGRYGARHSAARVRDFDVTRFDEEVEVVRHILTQAFADRPLYAELDGATHGFLLQSIARREDLHCFSIVEIDGRPVGLNLTAPNYDEELRGRPIQWIRSNEFAVLPEYHRTHAAVPLYHYSWLKVQRGGYAGASIGYLSEHSDSMSRMTEKVGSVRVKCHRLYQMPLNVSTDPISIGLKSAPPPDVCAPGEP
ncbi:hypothetical protein [Ectothiorhodospira lacustris]|uniref:hypothetical protein n=1 Tax=Ectothiorhodospira lacustris TaxID=2899127 RepID=UPI001EE98373|nr:hypothetical protein [Ectothiorhodospira lacustris]MCG5501601.1 hypothetical protein [Ectothiorhodospira lacustris]MCG5511453.1 hypothetical protein [Ectothiorhodospira lacustris]MCG5523239.1 hypothetical protein [Ectothiorhodospira lacustris]